MVRDKVDFTMNLTQNHTDLIEVAKEKGIILYVRWLIICNYNPHKTMFKQYFEYISKEIGSHSSIYDNFLLIGNFDSEPTEEAIKSFSQIHSFRSLLDKLNTTKAPPIPRLSI